MSWYKTAKNKGDCFVVSGRYVSSEGIKNQNLTLVHALIRPRMGRLAGVEYWHAWVEDGNKVIDLSEGKTGEKSEFPKDFYYALADPQQIHRYSYEETLERTLAEKNWGPWV
ncbi:MAG: hypothetical protein M0R32_09550 [Candidatus Cloacimonetes bacterium]|jgi:hypothetical protein|nr:hypothetical protein [Candidatus Cloacimonadota bacterium]